jgi:hypothetical protein
MSDPFSQGDELKRQYMEKALHANEEATSGAKFTDLFDKNSVVYTDQAAPQAESPKPKVPEKPTVDADGYPIIQNVHTYREDLAGIVNSDKLSLSRIAMMQQGVQQNTPVNTEPEATPKKSIIFYILSVALVLIGIGVVGGIVVLVNSKKEEVPAVVTPKEKYIIFSEDKMDINITKASRSEVSGDIKSMMAQFREEDSMLEIVPLVTIDDLTYKANLDTFLLALNQRAPDELLRTLSPKFFLGLYSKKGKTDPFLLMFTNSYDISYPALLEWEGFMKDDLTWLFDTSSKTASGTPVTLAFKDRIVTNTDARSFEDSGGRVAFFYTFLDPNTILFARNTDTVRKVMDRLREAKFQ